MASGGSSVSQWRVLTYLRDYIARTSPIVASFQRDLPHLVEKVVDTVHTNDKTTSLTEAQKVEDPGKTPSSVKADAGGSSEASYDLQKALRSVNAYIPLYFSQVRQSLYKRELPEAVEKNIPKWKTRKAMVCSKASIDARTRFLIKGLGGHLTESGQVRRLQELCTHLKQYPQAKGVAVKRGGIGRLLKMSELTNNMTVEGEVREALALLGYTAPTKAHGIRLLTIDGGGVRGLVALEVLRKIEEEAGRPVNELFDMICGVSTGAILAVMLGIHRIPLDECETLYKELSTKIFTQTTLKGATSLFMKNSYYDSDSWTEILKENMGEKCLIETARDDVAKVCLVATSANTNRVQAYLFRNYNLPYRVTSHYRGSSLPQLWEAVRASAAAPGYFSEFRIGDLIFLDGGLFVNNPSAIALHEAKQVWGDAALQCVVSVGTGRHEPIDTTNTNAESSISWATRIRTILNSATDTEGVHTTLHDLLPGHLYYRFNPYLSDDIGLDEISSDRLSLMMEDTKLYLRKNETKIQEAARSLSKTKTSLDRIKDWCLYQRQVWPAY
ncbi:hypothetical protein Pcinc_017025 [Petrolisthes cinctipes]|uniref:PNPLA domain-containing protein n=1 Tax=Petrolisthes cinctipes TaxID=88211 RepID=A0AAE1FQ41_PETCI|nr:hypothetical protein Pcinc_017025 [Petrolisthes cinctipes]